MHTYVIRLTPTCFGGPKHVIRIPLLALCYVIFCGRVPAANAPGCTAAEGLFYKPWSLVVPSCTARCLHQRP